MNNREIKQVAEQLSDAWNGDPWFGKPAQQLLAGITENEAYEQPGGQHSIAQLIWHMVNWRQFVLSRLKPNDNIDAKVFDTNDWRPAGQGTEYTLSGGLQQLEQAQADLLQTLKTVNDDLLDKVVEGRNYSFCKLLYGLIQHDIYHLGQVAYIVKLLRAKG